MERFIGLAKYTRLYFTVGFKIQYGEIYSISFTNSSIVKILFKIQYGEIYRRSINLELLNALNLKSSMERFIAKASHKRLADSTI